MMHFVETYNASEGYFGTQNDPNDPAIQLMAASLLACIPMIVLYLIFQKQFIEGIATSGGKL